VAKPTKHYDTWRIRWTDETGKRRSATFTEKKTAELALRKAELEAEVRRRGLRPLSWSPGRFSTRPSTGAPTALPRSAARGTTSPCSGSSSRTSAGCF
jgi:hypothetical protein